MQRGTFHVYVIELDKPVPAGKKGWLYVGSTGLTPEARFERHKQGGKFSVGTVTAHGKCLRPDLSAGVGPFSIRYQAERAEQQLANRLKHRGYFVRCGTARSKRKATRPTSIP